MRASPLYIFSSAFICLTFGAQALAGSQGFPRDVDARRPAPVTQSPVRPPGDKPVGTAISPHGSGNVDDAYEWQLGENWSPNNKMPLYKNGVRFGGWTDTDLKARHAYLTAFMMRNCPLGTLPVPAQNPKGIHLNPLGSVEKSAAGDVRAAVEGPSSVFSRIGHKVVNFSVCPYATAALADINLEAIRRQNAEHKPKLWAWINTHKFPSAYALNDIIGSSAKSSGASGSQKKVTVEFSPPVIVPPSIRVTVESSSSSQGRAPASDSAVASANN